MAVNTTIATTTSEGANAAPDSASGSTTINPIANLGISKTDGVASVNVGGSTTYTIVVSNAGPSPANGAIFTDAAVSNLSVTGVTCGSATGGAACPTSGNTTVALMQGAGIVIPTLPNGGSVTFSVTGTAGASGSIANVAAIAAPSGTTDPTLGNNTATDTDTITPIADVTTTLTAPSSANAGSTVNVPITFTNNGPSTAAGVTYSATLPSGLSGVSCTGATCAYNSGTGAITITGLAGSLTNGQTQNITLSYTAPATGPVAVSSTIATTTSEGANAGT